MGPKTGVKRVFLHSEWNFPVFLILGSAEGRKGRDYDLNNNPHYMLPCRSMKRPHPKEKSKKGPTRTEGSAILEALWMSNIRCFPGLRNLQPHSGCASRGTYLRGQTVPKRRFSHLFLADFRRQMMEAFFVPRFVAGPPVNFR